VGSATGNVIDSNTATGNTNGILIGSGARDTIVRQNLAVGNPAIQVGNTRPELRAADIVNLAPQGQTTFERNTCLTSVGAPCSTVQRPPQ
jgi:parallel beta-helix repeat protein